MSQVMDLNGMSFLMPMRRPPPLFFSLPFGWGRSFRTIVYPGTLGSESLGIILVSWRNMMSISFFLTNLLSSSFFAEMASMFSCKILSLMCLVSLNLKLEGRLFACVVAGRFRSSSVETQVGHSHDDRSPSSSTCFLVIPEHSSFLCQWLLHLEHMRKSSLSLIWVLHFFGGVPIVALHFPGVIPIVDGCFFGGRGGRGPPLHVIQRKSLPSRRSLLRSCLEWPVHSLNDLQTGLAHLLQKIGRLAWVKTL